MKQLHYLVRQAEPLSSRRAHCAHVHTPATEPRLRITTIRQGGGKEGAVVVVCVGVWWWWWGGGYKPLIKSPNIIFH